MLGGALLALGVMVVLYAQFVVTPGDHPQNPLRLYGTVLIVIGGLTALWGRSDPDRQERG